MRIHFAWEDSQLKSLRKLRKRIVTASEEEKTEIVKHLTLSNAFLLKRIRNNAFFNMIFYEIFFKPEIKKKYLPKLYELVSKSVMYEDEIEESLSKGGLRSEITFFEESGIQQLMKTELTSQDSILYLKKKLDYYSKDGDIDDIITAEFLLKEYITGRFTLGHFFSSATEKYCPRRFDALLESYALNEICYHTLFEQPNYPKNIFLPELAHLFDNNIKDEISEMLFKTLNVEKSLDVFLLYEPFLNHILSAICKMYFDDLSLEKKSQLLNENFEISDLIDLIDKVDVDWKYQIWRDAISKLDACGFYELSLKLINTFERKYLKNLEDKNKYNYYDTLGSIHRNLGHYDPALENYKKAFDYVETSEPYSLEQGDIISMLTKESPKNSKMYRKGVSLKNIGEVYGHLNKLEEKDKYFTEVENLIKKLENKYERYALYYNLSIASRRLKNYNAERDFLNKALNYRDSLNDSEKFEDMEQRLDEFLKTEMNSEKLYIIELDKEIDRLMDNGVLLQQSFHFKESIKFFDEAIKKVVSSSFNNKKYIIYKKLAFSYLYLHNWKKALEYFQEDLTIYDDFEAKLYSIIPLYYTGKKKEAIKSILELTKKLLENLELNGRYFYRWIIDMMNYFGEKNFRELIELMDKEESSDYKYEFFYNAGLFLVEKGFTNLSIMLFEKEVNITTNSKLKANYLNNIGTAYFDLDQYDLAIQKYTEAITVYPSFTHSYSNMAQAYALEGDYINAKKCEQKAINLAKTEGAPVMEIEAFKEALHIIEVLLKDSLNINRITSAMVQGIFNSAECLFYDYKSKGISDASPIIIEYAKGFERMLYEELNPLFEPLITKYQSKYKKRETVTDFGKKFGYLMQKRSVNLGSWAKIFEDVNESQTHQELRDFYQCLKTNFDDSTLNDLKNACEYIAPERNPISHTETLKMDEIYSRRKRIVDLLNPIIDKLY